MVTRPVRFEEVVPDKLKSAADGDDWLPAFQRADADARIISLRNGQTYELSGALRNSSNRLWRGNGATIRVDQANSNAAKRAAFMLGDQHPAAFKYASPGAGQYASYDLTAVLAGDTKVTCATTGDTSHFTVGQFVWVRHVTEVTSGGIHYPLYAQLTKVRALPGSGVVELEDPVLEPIPSACISGADAATDAFMGYPFEVVENVTIEHLTIENSRGLMSTRTGAYRCHIADVTTIGCEYLISAQAMVGCSARRVTGVVTDRMLEIKDYSQDCDWQEIIGRISGAGANTPIAIGEQSNRQRFRGVRCATSPDHTAVVPLVSLNGWLNSLRDCELIHVGAGAGQAVLQIPSNDFAGYGPDRNRIEGGRIVANANRTHHAIIGSAAAAEDPTGYVFDGVELLGVTSAARSIKVANGGTSGRVENCVLPYILEISTGAIAPSESGNSLTGISGGSIHTGTASPLSAISAESGSLYQRRGATDTMPAYLKTGTTANTGWIRLLTMSGISFRADVSVTISVNTPSIQIYNTPVTANRYITLPDPSAADVGWPFLIVKETSGGGGNVGVKKSDGTILKEIADASTGVIWCWWGGAAWHVAGMVTT